MKTAMARTLPSSAFKRHFPLEKKMKRKPTALQKNHKHKLQIKLQRRSFSRNRLNAHLGLGSKVVGTLLGSRGGHVNFTFQRSPSSPPALMIKLTAPIIFLVKEMASRIALVCDSWKAELPWILKAIEPISMGAGALAGNDEEESSSDRELMHFRGKFKRIVRSKDSEAFYMMNPDRNGAPELSIYILALEFRNEIQIN